MTESESFTSLLALVDSHLSRTSLNVSDNATSSNDNKITSFSMILGDQGKHTDTKFGFSPNQKLPLPAFTLSSSPIKDVLAEQVANMLKAKELKRQKDEEQQRLTEELKKMEKEEEEHTIELTSALLTPYQLEPLIIDKNEPMSNSSSTESIFNMCLLDGELEKVTKPNLPCKTDMSYILEQKIKMGKGSAFGRVLVAKYWPPTPHIICEEVKYNTNIKRFDFSTPSPCDLNNAKRLKTCHQ